MKYYKKSNSVISRSAVYLFVIIILLIGYFQRDSLSRSLITVNLGSIYVKLLNEKAEIANYFNNNDIETISISMSPNNYVRIQKERSQMVNNFIFNGSQWLGQNSYYKSSFKDNNTETKAEIRLFGLNPDHFRDVNGHSFRIKFDGGKGYGNKKVNFLNPRSRDFITDPLMNIIYTKLYNGIGIKYKPYRINLNKSNYGIMYKEDFFDKYLIEENRMRESVIFEIVNDSLKFNYKGDDDSLDLLAFEIEQLYRSDFNLFLSKIDIDKTKAVIKLGLLINDEHPFSDINLHWYYNPVTDMIEPTFREGFIKQINGEINPDRVANNNSIIRSLYSLDMKNQIISEISREIKDIELIINKDEDYLDLKNKMIGFKNQINSRETILRNNIKHIKKLILNNSEKNLPKPQDIRIKGDTILTSDLIISSNQKLIIEPGITLTLNNSFLKIYGGLVAEGSINQPININGKGRLGTIYINSKDNILINNVIFSNLTNKLSKYDQPASIIFYESESVKITNSIFKNNRSGDDYINFFRSKNIIIKNSDFNNILNDAIDSDFSDVDIINSSFSLIGNDAVDGSGSNIDIIDSSFSRIQDKAVSSGESSFVNIDNSIFYENEIAIVSKDASEVNIVNSKLFDNKIDFSSFIKKNYFGPTKAIFNNSDINNYLIENNSIIQGIDSIFYTTDVESKLYGNLYGRASQ